MVDHLVGQKGPTQMQSHDQAVFPHFRGAAYESP
jgi:hypothetical protein